MGKNQAFKRNWKKVSLVGVVLLILLSSSFAFYAQASSTWSETYSGFTTTGLIATSDGGYAMAGSFGYTIEGTYTGSGSLLRYDFILVKIDTNGTLQWTHRYDGGERGDAEATSLVQSSDGGYALAGKIADNVRSYNSDAWLVKTDSSGNMEWNRTYSGPNIGFAGDVVQTGDGGYILTGGTHTNTDPSLTDFWLIKTDAYGTVQWNQTYGTPEDYEVAYSLVEASDGGYALAGTTYNFTDNGIWLVKVDSHGNMEWNQTFGSENGTDISRSQALVATPDGGYALVGSRTTPGMITPHGTISKGMLIKTDARGDMEWNQTYGDINTDDILVALIQSTDGGYAMVGAKDLFGPTKGDVWLIKTDAQGNMLWNRTYSGLPDDYGQYHLDRGQALVQASDGGYTVMGETEYPVPDSSLGEMRVWLIKTNEVGSIPEFSTWTILSLVLALTLLAALIKKRQLKRV